MSSAQTTQCVTSKNEKPAILRLVFECERKTGFEPATFSLASKIHTHRKEYVVISNPDIRSLSKQKKKNQGENVVFFEFERSDNDIRTFVHIISASNEHVKHNFGQLKNAQLSEHYVWVNVGVQIIPKPTSNLEAEFLTQLANGFAQAQQTIEPLIYQTCIVQKALQVSQFKPLP